MTDTASASALGAAMATADRTPAGLTLARLEGLDLPPAPINPDWVLDGDPQARAVQIARGQDRYATLSVWDCTQGRFNWYFGCDEAVYILEGAVTVTGPDGEVRKLTAGDTAYFPAFTWFEWQVHGYVRKVAFCHDVVPPAARLPLRIYGRVSRIVARIAAAVFGGSRTQARPAP